MFRNALQNLHKPLQRSVVNASFTKYATYWTMLAVLSVVGLIIGLDTIMNGALLSLPGQLGAEGSTRPVDRSCAGDRGLDRGSIRGDRPQPSRGRPALRGFDRRTVFLESVGAPSGRSRGALA